MSEKLICDGETTLPVRPFKLDVPSHVLAECARVLGRRIALSEAFRQALELSIEREQRLARELAEETAQLFVWLEESVDAGKE